MRSDAKKYRRYVWAVLRDIEQPLDVTTRVRVFANCHDLSPRTRLDHPSYATSLSNIQKGLERLERFAKSLGK